MTELISIAIYVFIFWGIISAVKKKKGGMFGPMGTSTGGGTQGASQAGAGRNYQSYSGSQTHNTAPGTIPHKHETAKYHNAAPGTIPHSHKEKKFHSTESGSMAHDHFTGKYRSMADASQLPPGYILLNGEPVRVADLEGK